MAVFNVMPSQFTSIDIRDTLNANGGNVGDFSGDLFSEKAKINKWSKRKPVRDSSLFQIGDYEMQRANYGLEINRYNDIWQVFNAYLNNTSNYIHLLPRGVNYNEWLRVSDFIGYMPDAPNAVEYWQVSPEGISTDYYSRIESSFGFRQYSQGVILSEVIPNFNNLYFGIGVVPTKGYAPNYITSNITLGNYGTNISFPSGDLLQGDYYTFPILTDTRRLSLKDDMTSAEFYTLDAMNVRGLKIYRTPITTELYAGRLYPSEPYEVEYEIRINNVIGSQISMKNSYIEFRFKNSDPNSALRPGEIIIDLGTINIAAYQNYTYVNRVTLDMSPDLYDVVFRSTSYDTYIRESVY